MCDKGSDTPDRIEYLLERLGVVKPPSFVDRPDSRVDEWHSVEVDWSPGERVDVTVDGVDVDNPEYRSGGVGFRGDASGFEPATDGETGTYALSGGDISYEGSFSVDLIGMVADTLRDNAGHEFVCDRFDEDTYRDAIHAVESSTVFDTFRWYLPPDAADGLREWYDVRDRTDTPSFSAFPSGTTFNYPVYEVPEDAFGADAFLVADRAVSEPPTAIWPVETPIIVIEPAGVARIDTSAGFEWGPK